MSTEDERNVRKRHPAWSSCVGRFTGGPRRSNVRIGSSKQPLPHEGLGSRNWVTENPKKPDGLQVADGGTPWRS